MRITERRRSPRRPIYFPASVSAGDGAKLSTHVCDLSAGGAMLACVGIDGHVALSIKLDGSTVNLRATVVRREPGRTAVQFGGMTGRDRTAIEASCRSALAMA